MKYVYILLIFFLPTNASSATVNEAQRMLKLLGYSIGSLDGIYGKKTKNALKNFYRSRNEVFDDSLDENEIVDLRDALISHNRCNELDTYETTSEISKNHRSPTTN